MVSSALPAVPALPCSAHAVHHDFQVPWAPARVQPTHCYPLHPKLPKLCPGVRQDSNCRKRAERQDSDDAELQKLVDRSDAIISIQPALNHNELGASEPPVR